MRDTQDLCITYGGVIPADELNKIIVYADADFSSKPNIRKSRSGHVIYLNNGAIAWKSALQKKSPSISGLNDSNSLSIPSNICSIATSTSESELYAMFDATRAAKWFRELLRELGFFQRQIRCHEDNKGCVDWITTPKISSRMIHLPLEVYWLRESYEHNEFDYILTPTEDQKADVLTKQMDPKPFHRQLIMLYNL